MHSVAKDAKRDLICKIVECKNWGNFKQLYPTVSYKEFVAYKKLKGLDKNRWKDLPKMWKEELRFRKDTEDWEKEIHLKQEREQCLN